MSAPPTLVFDGTCRFCRAGVQRLRRVSGIDFAAVPSQSDEAHALLPQLGEADFASRLYLVVGPRHYGGAEAVARALMFNPWWRPLAALYYLPGVRQAADAAYRWVAKRRHCLGGVCEVGR